MLNDSEACERLLVENGLPTEKVITTKSANPIYLRASFILITTLLALGVGFFAGLQAADHDAPQILYPNAVPQGILSVSISTISRIFLQHKEFMVPPPIHSAAEPSWDSLLPKGLGYVRNPFITATENISTIAAFHQLHCLYILRRTYYSSVSGSQKLEMFDNGVDRESHVAHCFEYLRQALMCSADSSLEPFKVPVGGFPGMGFERQCRDYEGLKNWAEDWRIMDAEGFILNSPLHNHSVAEFI